MQRRTRSQTQPPSSSTSPTASNPEAPKRPRKEKVTELSDMDMIRISNHQAQLEEAIRTMSQEMSNIKGLLERLLFHKPLRRQGVMSLSKSGALSSKLPKPPCVVRWPQGVARTHRKSPSLGLSQLSLLCRAVEGRTLRLDQPDLIMKQCQASRQGLQHHLGLKRRNKLEEGLS